MKRFFRVLPAFLAVLILGAGFSAAPLHAEENPGYVIGADDVMEITVYGEKDLSKSYKVSQAGMIAMPLIGDVAVTGLSLPAAQNLIAEKLSDGYLVKPSVAIQITSSRPFYIMGEVRNPGSYAYAGNMNVLNAVALAGGFTYRAREKNVDVMRGEEKIQMPVEARIMPGDVITVNERLF